MTEKASFGRGKCCNLRTRAIAVAATLPNMPKPQARHLSRLRIGHANDSGQC